MSYRTLRMFLPSVASSYTCKADVLVLKSNLGGLHINFCIRGLKLSSEVL